MQKIAKIVVVSQHYPPDQSTTAAIMAAIAGHLASQTPVLVLSGTPEEIDAGFKTIFIDFLAHVLTRFGEANQHATETSTLG